MIVQTFHPVKHHFHVKAGGVVGDHHTVPGWRRGQAMASSCGVCDRVVIRGAGRWWQR